MTYYCPETGLIWSFSSTKSVKPIYNERGVVVNLPVRRIP